jgi:hypothetical protein
MAKSYDGDGGGEVTEDAGEIQKIDGNGHWIIWGLGQDLVILDKKDGKGTCTLKNFGSIEIRNKKDGDGVLIVEDSKSIQIREVNGSGQTYFRIDGRKVIDTKDGAGNIYFKGAPPIVREKNGPGKVLREG